jgi:serine/threonine-protein kinase/endoribonuclease IRE1
MRILISDFGLCKKLEGDQSTFRPTTAQPGTLGWTAPELSHYHAPLDDEHGVEQMLANPRLTRAVDIFSLGCVFYYVLSNGLHPFSQTEEDLVDETSGPGSTKISTYQVQNNIDRGKYRLAALEDLSQSNAPEARDLISRMIAWDSKDRPDIGTVLVHPLFWPLSKRLDFLLKVSDRFEADTREEYSEMLERFEANAQKVIGANWHARLDQEFLGELNRYRKYRPERLIDLLRAMRNKGHHFGDLPPDLQEKMGPYPDNFLLYFTSKFPHMLMVVYYFVKDHLSGEPSFVPFFHLNQQHI